MNFIIHRKVAKNMKVTILIVRLFKVDDTESGRWVWDAAEG